MRSILRHLIAYVSLFFIIKFCTIFGYLSGMYWSAEQFSQIHCKTVIEFNKLKYGTEGECGTIKMPSNDKLTKEALRETFNSFP